METRMVAGLLLLGLMLSPSASARQAPKPVMEAELVELDADGNPIDSLYKYHLTLNKSGDRAVSFTMVERFGSPCPPGAMCILPYWEIQREFRIVRDGPAGCGSRKLYAVSVEKRRNSSLTVIDHSQRLCDDYQPFAWVISLQDSRAKVKRLAGNPRPIGSQDCSEIAKDTICTMQYAPATCSADSIDGERLKEPIIAQGGNPCMAAANVRVAACERGYDAQTLDDEEITCLVKPVCPLFMCAAPPAGCRYVPNDKVNEDGCPASCGDIVCDVPVDPF